MEVPYFFLTVPFNYCKAFNTVKVNFSTRKNWGFRKEDRKRQSATKRPHEFKNLMTALYFATIMQKYTKIKRPFLENSNVN